RKNGHNEGDEPKFTQPLMYVVIDKHPNPREIYTQYLLSKGEPEAQNLAKEMERVFWDELQARLDESKQNPLPYTYQKPEQWWQSLTKAKATDFATSPETNISGELFQQLFNSIMNWPESFKPNRKIDKLLKDKVKVFEGDKKIDWATG